MTPNYCFRREALETGVTILNYFNYIIFKKIIYPYEKQMSAQNKVMTQNYNL